MTREELRQESRETEGNPTLRARMRAVHRQLATRRMMAAVKRADLVLRNPTHVAVALRYVSGRMAAPRVVAKGEHLLALRIVDVAYRHGVPVIENPPLARTLYRTVALGREIPRDLYRAVADVLAYVYSLRRGGR
jgi:flagellar biosynthetic protein FlhB